MTEFEIKEVSVADDITLSMMTFIFQIAVIVFAAKLGGTLFKRLSLPSVLGELITGILIGPYFLGSFPFPMFPDGVFSLYDGTLPVSYELYSIATLASIVLLFLVGLETDVEMFKRYSLAGLVIGAGGIVTSFFAGIFTAGYFMELPLISPKVLFMGVVSTATSVGITARILSERRKLDSPEGITILGGAVVSDVIGIVLLAVTLGLASAFENGHDSIDWGTIGFIKFKAVSVLSLFLFAGMIFAHKIANLLKRTGDRYSITMLALGLALAVSGIFEHAGLAMIIGAYITGLSLSKTDISYIVQETLHPLQTFLVLIFFVIMGMLVDPRIFLSQNILLFGFIYTLGAIAAKLIGCSIPSFFIGFNKTGATRIGIGMIQRGEVALIMAGVGFSHGILDRETFGVVIMMALLSTLSAPPMLNAALKNKKRGTAKEPISGNTVRTEFTFDSKVITRGLVSHIRDYLSSEGFYIYMMTIGCRVYQIRKEKTFIKMSHYPEKIEFVTSPEDAGFVKALVYEAFVELYQDVERISRNQMPDSLIRNIGTDKICSGGRNLADILEADCVIMDLKSDNKEGAVSELVNLFYQKGYIDDPDEIIKEVIEREKIISTGFKNGFACPHARVEGIDHIHIAVGIKKEGIKFDSIDGVPAKVITLLISSTEKPEHHVETLAALAAIFVSEDNVKRILRSPTPEKVVSSFRKLSSRSCVAGTNKITE